MKKLLIGAALASLTFAPAANAASWIFGNLVITQISAEIPTTFANNPIGATVGFSSVCDSAYCGKIDFATDGSVQQGTTGAYAEPAGDGTHYLYGVNGLNPNGYNGAQVGFDDYFPNSFNIFWGSIDALTTSNGSNRYDNVLSVHTFSTVDTVTGSDLVAAGVFGVNGFGDQLSAADNQWFNVWDTAGSIIFFTASSSNNAFEFDMGAVPEPSTWAMMGLGFAALGYAAFRRGAKARASFA